jgi:hypothetical protein
MEDPKILVYYLCEALKATKENENTIVFFTIQGFFLVDAQLMVLYYTTSLSLQVYIKCY